MLTIAIDPSGNFEEGKGNTGVAIVKDDSWESVATKSISARHYLNRYDYWTAVRDIIKTTFESGVKARVVIESYVTRANGFTIGKMPETAMLIGVLVYYCEEHNIPYIIQSPAQAKTRFKDVALTKYIPNLERRESGRYYLNGKCISDHERDAIKHLLYFKKYKEYVI